LRRRGVGKVGKVAGIIVSLVFLLFFASLLSSSQQANKTNQQAVSSASSAVIAACVTLSSAVSQDHASGAWGTLTPSQQASISTSLQQCVAEGYLPSSSLLSTSLSSSTDAWESQIVQVNSRAVAITNQSEEAWSTFQNNTLLQPQFENQSRVFESQLDQLIVMTNSSSVPIQWRFVYANYTDSLVAIRSAIQLENTTAYELDYNPIQGQALYVQALNEIASLFQQAANDINLSNQSWPK